MRVLIAPDKFKGSLDARDVAENVARGIRDVLPGAEIDIAPVADGGEGTADVIRGALGGEWISAAAHDALGREIKARYAWIAKSELAVFEMSEAAGLARVASADRDVLRANTFGVGEMMLEARDRGAREIIIGLGGSATNDGGFGMARALGFRFFGTANGREFELNAGPADLTVLDRIVAPADLHLPRIVAAIDVRNPLLGVNGATQIFGAQKGADTSEMRLLEDALTRFADIIAHDLGIDWREAAGAGAAGGLGFGLMTFGSAIAIPGFDLVAGATKLEQRVAAADIVITGEGKLDAQTREGKAPFGVAKLARKHGKPVLAIVGIYESEYNVFDEILALARPPISQTLAIKLTAQLLRERGAEVARKYG